MVAAMRTFLLAATVAIVGLTGCGSDAPRTSSSPRTTPASATTSTLTMPSRRSLPPVAARRPSADDIETAKAICAEDFYAQAFTSRGECETAMSDPQAVAELRKSVENYAKP
jgi:hypothetical protein